MGNAAATYCLCSPYSSTAAVKLVMQGGGTRILRGKHIAGEIMFDFPDHMVCRADSFFIGQPIPSLAIDDELINGQTYFLLPLDCIAHNVLSASSLAALGAHRAGGAPVRFKDCPFEYLKGSDGRVLIRVLPEFITRLIGAEDKKADHGGRTEGKFLCSTPELQKHYDQLVGPKDQIWSPKLETISEYKIRFSPCRFIGLEWKEKEVDSL